MQGTCTIVNGSVCFEPYDRNLQKYLLIYLLIWCSQQRCYMWNQQELRFKQANPIITHSKICFVIFVYRKRGWLLSEVKNWEMLIRILPGQNMHGGIIFFHVIVNCDLISIDNILPSSRAWKSNKTVKRY